MHESERVKAELNLKLLVSELGWAVSPESSACPMLQVVCVSLNQGRGAQSKALEGRDMGSTTGISPALLQHWEASIPTAVIPFIALVKMLIASCFQRLLF